MKLYRYRKVRSALRDIKEGTFYFAPPEELNDPIEGYYKVYWKGDKAAWEGLFCNYIYSLNQAITLYILNADTKALFQKTIAKDVHKFDNFQLGKVLSELKESFLHDDEIQKISDFYGDNITIVSERELCFILRFIHHKALELCIQKGLETGTIPTDTANSILNMLTSFKDRSFPFEELEKTKGNDNTRKIIVKTVIDAIDDFHEYQFLKIGFDKKGFFYDHDKPKNESKEIDEKTQKTIDENIQKRNWMAITVDYPAMYVKQIIEILYPKSYIACFSPSGTDSAMWGNYADNHKGICFIYDTSDNDVLCLTGEERITVELKPVQYGGDLLERNFFESLGLLSLPQIKTMLTGTSGISVYYDAYTVNERIWREDYWKTIELKLYRKTKDWESEKEIRAVLLHALHDFSEKEKRKMQFDPSLLKGIIFGINTSEYDKKSVFEELKKKASLYRNSNFAVKNCESILKIQ